MKKYIGLVLVLLLVLQAFGVEAASFKDVNPNDWYYENVRLLVEDGALQGYPDNSFRPKNTITKAEFIKSTMSLLGYQDIESRGLHWADGYIAKAMELGIVNSQISANPDLPITRYTMANIVSNLLTYQKYAPERELTDYEPLIRDIREISRTVNSETKTAVLRSYSSGILTGYDDGDFKGYNSLSRSEAASLLLRIKYKEFRLETIFQAKPDQEDKLDHSQRVLELVNIERSAVGLKALKMNMQLSKVAYEKSKDMATSNYFSHHSPNYGSPFEMMKKFGISYMTAGENIAMGQPTPEAVVKTWMNSQGHRENILGNYFGQLGVGVYNHKGTIYWTQMFID